MTIVKPSATLESNTIRAATETAPHCSTISLEAAPEYNNDLDTGKTFCFVSQNDFKT